MTDITTFGWPYRLHRGHSNDPARGSCAMDAVNWLVHGKHGDEPACACPVIGRFVMAGNDAMPDDTRQQLLRYLHRIAGSRSAKHVADRLRVMALAAVRAFLPARMEVGAIVTFRNATDRLRHIDDAAAYADMLAMIPGGYLRTGWREIALKDGAAALNPAETVALALTWARDIPAVAPKHRHKQAVDAAALCGRAAERLPDRSDYFATLDAALNAGPQGEPWSADIAAEGARRYTAAGGKRELVEAAAS